MKREQLQALQQALKTLVAIQDFWHESEGCGLLNSGAMLLDSDDTIHEAVAASITAFEENFPEIME